MLTFKEWLVMIALFAAAFACAAVLCFLLVWGVIVRPAHAQGYGGSDWAPPYDSDAFHPSQELANWFESLKRPIGSERDFLAQVTSCCDLGDAYPIEIIEEATSNGQSEDGIARVTDPSARSVQLPNNHIKYRDKITGPLTFKYPGVAVVKEKYGNPTKTAWAFLRVETQNESEPGHITFVYCIVPLPPGF
jgi:hypothetical protein